MAVPLMNRSPWITPLVFRPVTGTDHNNDNPRWCDIKRQLHTGAGIRNTARSVVNLDLSLLQTTSRKEMDETTSQDLIPHRQCTHHTGTETTRGGYTNPPGSQGASSFPPRTIPSRPGHTTRRVDSADPDDEPDDPDDRSESYSQFALSGSDRRVSDTDLVRGVTHRHGGGWEEAVDRVQEINPLAPVADYGVAQVAECQRNGREGQGGADSPGTVLDVIVV
jgi:hypothetical protein